MHVPIRHGRQRTPSIALKDVELSRVVFVQYPAVAWSEDANKVVPDRDAADALFERIASGQDITVSPNVTASAVEEAGPDAAAPVDPDDPAAEEGSPPPASPESDQTAPAFTGQTAAERTCAVSS